MSEFSLPPLAVRSNVGVYYSIAAEAFKRMEATREMGKRPKEDGSGGFIFTLTSSGSGFREALIAIVFCGMYLEAVLHLLMAEQLGIAQCKKFDRKSYREKLALLGCQDVSLMSKCDDFGEARREAVHEKAYLTSDSFRIAQSEAARAFELINAINSHFGLEMQ